MLVNLSKVTRVVSDESESELVNFSDVDVPFF